MTLLTLLSGYGEAAVAPSVAIDFEDIFISQSNVGLHMLASDASINIAGTTIKRNNVLQSDVGWKIKRSSVRLNIREG